MDEKTLKMLDDMPEDIVAHGGSAKLKLSLATVEALIDISNAIGILSEQLKSAQ